MSDEADIVTIVSSDLIATVMEEYFNKKMYKIPVHIVELKPTEVGYSFFLQFVPKTVNVANVNVLAAETVKMQNGVRQRNNKGHFVKKGQQHEQY